MRVVVTGCAGFVGSHIAEACLDRGDQVLGIDALTDYYDTDQKRANLVSLDRPGFEYVQADLADGCHELIEGADAVFHQAGQPGVRASWRANFDVYLSRNVLATQRLLDAALDLAIPRIVYASSSSVYGNATHYPVSETSLPRPFSPYGATKLAAEHLCSLYAANFGLPVVSLRYFTVYGPRQRPDMATHRLIESALNGTPFPLFGSGEQVREFTFVSDIVAANLAAAAADVAPGLVANLTGGSECSLNELIATVGEVVGPPNIERHDPERGDVTRTSGTTDVARTALGWSPVVGLSEGVRAQAAWHRGRSGPAWPAPSSATGN